MPTKVASEEEVKNVVANMKDNDGVKDMTLDRMEGGDLEAKEHPQSVSLERSCLCGRYIA